MKALPPGQFWMTRQNHFYRLHRRKPKKASWGGWSVYGITTYSMCVDQLHRLFPDLPRMRTIDNPKLVEITWKAVDD